jgi:RHS repeat-associated protein
MLLRLAECGILSLGNPISLASDPAGRVNWGCRSVFRRDLSEGLRVIRNLISRLNPSAVASATAGSCIAPTPTRLKTSQTCYHRNQQYSIVGLTNAAGTLVERYTYSAYGTLGIYAANGTVRTSSTYANRYTYTGREWDHDLRLYHFRARWYDPATGGFISRDPLGYVDGMSLYRGYFGVMGVDPSGLVYIPQEGGTAFDDSDNLREDKWRYHYSPQQIADAESACRSLGYCFCPTEINVSAFKRGDHQRATNGRFRSVVKWTVQGEWKQGKGGVGGYPTILFYEWWDRRLNGLDVDDGRPGYAGKQQRTWHNMYPDLQSWSTFHGYHDDSSDDPNVRWEHSTGLSVCSAMARCKGAIDKLPTQMTFLDFPGYVPRRNGDVSLVMRWVVFIGHNNEPCATVCGNNLAQVMSLEIRDGHADSHLEPVLNAHQDPSFPMPSGMPRIPPKR